MFYVVLDKFSYILCILHFTKVLLYQLEIISEIYVNNYFNALL